MIEPVYLDQHIRVTKPGEDWDPMVTGIPRGSISVRDFLGRFTNMSALLISTSVLIFLIGLVSEQITNLLYAHRGD